MLRKDSKEFEVPVCALGIQRALEKARSTLVCDYVDDVLDDVERKAAERKIKPVPPNWRGTGPGRARTH